MTLEQACKDLLITEPFYGVFLLGIPRKMSKEIPTAAVVLKDGSTALTVNPDYWESLEDKYQTSLLLHEIYHIVFKHMFMCDDLKDAQKRNIAADCEVNSYIQPLADNWVKAEKYNLESKKGTLYYYNNLPEDCNDKDSQADSHDSWTDFSELTEETKEILKDQIDFNIKEAADAIEKSCGKIPEELSEMIDRLRKRNKPVYNWKKHFRRMLGNIRTNDLKKTSRRESKRFDGAKGITHLKTVNVLVAIDTSGSIYDKDFTDFFDEIHHIYKSGAKIDIMECDCKINKMYPYKGICPEKIYGRGGTDFQPATDYYFNNRRKYNAMVYFTDGYCTEPENIPANVIWVITQDGNKINFKGKTIYITEQ